MNKSAIFVAILAVFLFTTLVTVDCQKPGPGGFGGRKKLVKRDVSSNKAFISDEELEFDKGE